MQYTLALAEQAPLVLFVDDLQWADSATLDLLQYAIRRWRDNATRILLLVSLRSEALHPMTQPQQTGGPTGFEPVVDARGTRIDASPYRVGATRGTRDGANGAVDPVATCCRFCPMVV